MQQPLAVVPPTDAADSLKDSRPRNPNPMIGVPSPLVNMSGTGIF